MEQVKYFVQWREDFEDQQSGGLSLEEVFVILDRLTELGWDHITGSDGDGEACLECIIEGEYVRDDILHKYQNRSFAGI